MFPPTRAAPFRRKSTSNNTRDRAEAFGATFLGLTVGCAACHDHKFDPISQQDFYSLAAFFNNTSEKPWDENIAEPRPILRLPPPRQTRGTRRRDRPPLEGDVAKYHALRTSATEVSVTGSPPATKPHRSPPTDWNSGCASTKARRRAEKLRAGAKTAATRPTPTRLSGVRSVWFWPDRPVDIASNLTMPGPRRLRGRSGILRLHVDATCG